MSEWSVGAVGAANPNVAAFTGAALKVMGEAGLDRQFIDHFMHQLKELTSPYPLVEGVKNQSLAVAGASRGENFSPSATTGISGQGITLA